MTRMAGVLIGIVLVAASRASADDAHYYPEVSGPPVGSVVGRLTDIGFGMGSGGLTVRTAAGKTVDLYTAHPPFKINGKTVECPQPPKRDFVPSREDCPRWPSSVVVGRSDVRVPYWRGERYGNSTLITNGFNTIETLERRHRWPSRAPR